MQFLICLIKFTNQFRDKDCSELQIELFRILFWLLVSFCAVSFLWCYWFIYMYTVRIGSVLCGKCSLVLFVDLHATCSGGYWLRSVW